LDIFFLSQTASLNLSSFDFIFSNMTF
jgi:hypothetical protein